MRARSVALTLAVVAATASLVCGFSSGVKRQCLDTPNHGDLIDPSTIENDDFVVRVTDEAGTAPVTVLVAGETYLINITSVEGVLTVRGFQFHPMLGEDVVTLTGPRVGTIIPVNLDVSALNLTNTEFCEVTCETAAFSSTGVCNLQQTCTPNTDTTTHTDCQVAATHNGVVPSQHLIMKWQAPAVWPSGATHVTFLAAPIVLQFNTYILREWTTLPISVVPSSPLPSPAASPAGTPGATPAASPAGTPVATPASTPAVTPAGTPGSTPGASPASTPAGTPVATPAASPGASPASTPAGTPGASPVASPASSPGSTPAATPAASVASTPNASPAALPSSPAAPVEVLTCSNVTCGANGACVEGWSGRGASCACAVGWDGPSCDMCAAGFQSSASSPCGVVGTSTTTVHTGVVHVRVTAGSGRRALLTAAQSSGAAAIVTELQSRMPTGASVTLVEEGAALSNASTPVGSSVGPGWLSLLVAAPDSAALTTAVTVVRDEVTNSQSDTHAALRSAGLGASAATSSCAGALCLQAGAEAVQVQLVQAPFASLAVAALARSTTLMSGTTLRWGVFSPPGPLSDCATWPGGVQWTRADTAPPSDASAVYALVLEVTREDAESWVGLGFPASPGAGMLGATAAVGQPGLNRLSAVAQASVRMPTAASQCAATLPAVLGSLASGVAAHDLSARTLAGTGPASSQLPLVAASILTGAAGSVPGSPSARSRLRVALLVSGSQQSTNPSVALPSDRQLEVVWAAGADGTVLLRQHPAGSRGTVTLDLFDPAVEEEGGGLLDDPLLAAHGACMVIAWMVAIPAAMLLALLRTTPCLHHPGAVYDRAGLGGAAEKPCWFKAHLALQAVGVVFSLVGLITGGLVSIAPLASLHGIIGLVVGLVQAVQVVAALARPHRTGSLLSSDETAGPGEQVGRGRIMSVYGAAPGRPARGRGRPSVMEAAREAEKAEGEGSGQRTVWEWAHRGGALLLVILATAGGVTGVQRPGVQAGLVTPAVVVWCIVAAALLAAALYRAWAVDAYGVEGSMAGQGKPQPKGQSTRTLVPRTNPMAASPGGGRRPGRSRRSMVGAAGGDAGANPLYSGPAADAAARRMSLSTFAKSGAGRRGSMQARKFSYVPGTNV